MRDRLTDEQIAILTHLAETGPTVQPIASAYLLSLCDEVTRLRRERADYETTVISIADRTGAIAMKCVESSRTMQERCAEACIELFRAAPNTKESGYKQNQISHGCIACAAAIRSLTLPEPAEG